VENALPRTRLPQDRAGMIRKIKFGPVELFARVGCYEDGTPGELFVTQAGESGTHVACLWDALGIVTSLAPVRSIVDHWRGMRAGDVCGTPSADEIASASSALDALAKWFAQKWPEEVARPSLAPDAPKEVTP
jgi:ribonucleoside-diphosphate reductase alpha chain